MTSGSWPESKHEPDCCMNQSPVIPLIESGAGSSKARHSLSPPRKREESGDPKAFMIEVDSRFRGNDDLKKTATECGLPSLTVILIHTLLRPGNPVFCAVPEPSGPLHGRIVEILILRGFASRIRARRPSGRTA